jgi:hypothetical protein
MGLLFVGVLAGFLIGIAWLGPSGYPQACTFQWQGCFDHIGAGGLPPQAPPPNADPPTAQAAQRPAKHASTKSHGRLALAKKAAQPTKTNVLPSEHRPVETADPVLERARASVAAKLENPASAEFSDMDRAFRKNTFGRATDTICGHVRGKTASGGGAAERPFLYLVKEDDAYVVDGKPDSAAAIAYRNICN